MRARNLLTPTRSPTLWQLLKFNASDLNIRQDCAGMVAKRIFESFVESELREMELFRDLSTRQMKEVTACNGT